MKVESVWFKDALLIPRWPRLSNKKIKKELDYEKKELIKLLKKHRFISFSNFFKNFDFVIDRKTPLYMNLKR